MCMIDQILHDLLVNSQYLTNPLKWLRICFQTGGMCFPSVNDIEPDDATLYEVSFKVSESLFAVV